MKIGILTYHRALNYGALLQAYALRSYLERQGHETEIIDYWPSYHAGEYQLFSFEAFKRASFLGRCKYLAAFLIGVSRILKRRQGYFSFMKERLGLPKKERYRAGKDIQKHYDVVVYGSDQIWRKQKRPDFFGFDEVYFGAFPMATKKISYAASVGIMDFDGEEKAFFKRALKNFHAISVREGELQKMIEENGYQADLVLDPVFLLEADEWRSFFPRKRMIPGKKYILFYQHIPSEEAVQFVKRLEKTTGYEVRIVRAQVYPFLIGKRYVQTASPADMLLWIAQAEIVISTSFHGAAFAVIFEKQFYCLGMKNNAARVKTLLASLGIEERYLDQNDTTLPRGEIDYVIVNERLKALRGKAKSFLREALTWTLREEGR